MPTIVMVYRSGGDYDVEHVAALAAGIRRNILTTRLACISDVGLGDLDVERIPFRAGWPGWWAKMALFDPALDPLGDLLYLDLDTVVCGPLDALAARGATTLLSDFFHPARSASGLMYLTPADRATVWGRWIVDPHREMIRCHAWDDGGVRGDGKLIGEALPDADRWQNVLPGLVVSYKRDVMRQKDRIPGGASVVCFHGHPRPWRTPVWRAR